MKPAREDNSNGVTHFKEGDTQEDLQKALDEAFKWDDKVLVEEFIPGREIRVAIVPQKVIDNIDENLEYSEELDSIKDGSEELVVLPFLEYLFPEGTEIRTDTAKLNLDKDGQPIGQNKNAFKASKLPSIVSDDLSKELAEQAKLAFKAFDCKHYCVFDFRVKKDPKTGKETPYLLEACPSAGFSPASIVVRMADKFTEIGGPDL